MVEENTTLIGHKVICTIHNIGIHNEKYDSYYCPECKRWLEPQCKCGGDDCKWFPDRPKIPLI